MSHPKATEPVVAAAYATPRNLWSYIAAAIVRQGLPVPTNFTIVRTAVFEGREPLASLNCANPADARAWVEHLDPAATYNPTLGLAHCRFMGWYIVVASLYPAVTS